MKAFTTPFMFPQVVMLCSPALPSEDARGPARLDKLGNILYSKAAAAYEEGVKVFPRM